MRNWKARTCILACTIVVLGSCESKDDPPPPPVTIPCRVIIVTAAGESVGYPGNLGCRLTQAQVQGYMDALNANGSMYGADVTFSFSEIEHWGSLNYTSRPFRFINWWSLMFNPDLPNDNDPNYDPSKINIYFAGRMYFDDSAGDRVNGNTTDPFDAIPRPPYWLPFLPHIVITDRSYGSNPQGFVDLPDRVLEHEMCHFLIRQKTGVNPGARYDSSEHDPDGRAQHLMRKSTSHGHINAPDFEECKVRVLTPNGWL